MLRARAPRRRFFSPRVHEELAHVARGFDIGLGPTPPALAFSCWGIEVNEVVPQPFPAGSAAANGVSAPGCTRLAFSAWAAHCGAIRPRSSAAVTIMRSRRHVVLRRRLPSSWRLVLSASIARSSGVRGPSEGRGRLSRWLWLLEERWRC